METAKLRLALLLGGGLETFLGGMETPLPKEAGGPVMAP